MDTTSPFIVGVGASAGGTQALSQPFAAVPEDSGIGFVVVTHLSPDHESRLHKVLAQHTDLPVKTAKDGAPVEANTIHVMPERSLLTIADGELQLHALWPDSPERKPIDAFFAALAEDQKENA